MHGQLSSRDQAEFNGFSWVRSLLVHVALALLNFTREMTGRLMGRNVDGKVLVHDALHDNYFSLPCCTISCSGYLLLSMFCQKEMRLLVVSHLPMKYQ